MRSLLPFVSMLFRQKGWVLAGILLSLVTLLAAIGLLTLSGWFISAAALAGVSALSSQQFNYFTPGAGVRGFALARTAGRYLERITTHEATFRMLAYLRGWFYRRLEALGPARLQGYRSGDLLNRLVADINALDNLYLRVLVPTLVAVLVALLVGIFLALYSPSIAGVALVGLALAGVVLPLIAQQVGRTLGQRQVTLLSDLRVRLLGMVQGQADLHIYGGVGAAIEQVQAVERQLQRTQLRMALISGLTSALVVFIGGVAGLVTLMLGIDQVQAGGLAPAHLAMLLFCVLAVFEAVAPLPLAYQYLSKTSAAAERLLDISQQPVMQQFPEHGAMPMRPGEIEFDQVSLCYANDAPPAIDRLSFCIRPGERVLVLGHTGSGKSSLVNLLARFHAADTGRVLLGGCPVETFDESTLRTQLSVLSQPVQLFAGSVADNLRLAGAEMPDVEMLNVLSMVELDEALGEQPLSWPIGESGNRLSGGQRKRLALARALLKPSPVLILDEPTEGLDAETESRVMSAVLRACFEAGRTLVMISHHLQMAEAFDRILILDKGSLLEAGTPAELKARSDSRFNQLLAL
ncbi:thiol reductant ABC exporter subunit CydC [Marinobacterium weihaiense]|uniref:Thiol reductant ABC exporter subunit CydC n=1 Tax=Marinobacterium weihaiense TaxID=2851016 RepID=A0ABS6M7B7_9GAMM|nr:thiol reductant ABC exporter subunit CydC [Marinobacterium weihaiense]MBV0932167.1 thiol reductant ABC exporter subunit CydC [Marinobacterium weihaiense]